MTGPIFAVPRPDDRVPFLAALAALAELDTAPTAAETGLDLHT